MWGKYWRSSGAGSKVTWWNGKQSKSLHNDMTTGRMQVEDEAAITARTWYEWIKLRQCSELLYGCRCHLKLKGVDYKNYTRPAILHGLEALCQKESKMGIAWTEVHGESNLEENMRFVLSREDVLSRTMWIIGVNLIATRLSWTWPPWLIGDTIRIWSIGLSLSPRVRPRHLDLKNTSTEPRNLENGRKSAQR